MYSICLIYISICIYILLLTLQIARRVATNKYNEQTALRELQKK